MFQALPWPAFVAAGGWAGYAFLGPELLKLAAARGISVHWQAVSPELAAKLVGLAAGAAVGWLLSSLLNRSLGWIFLLFNKGFDLTTSIYTRMVGGLLRISVLVLLLYGGLLGPDLLGHDQDPHRVYPSPRQRLPAGQRPASGFFLARADSKSDGPG